MKAVFLEASPNKVGEIWINSMLIQMPLFSICTKSLLQLIKMVMVQFGLTTEEDFNLATVCYLSIAILSMLLMEETASCVAILITTSKKIEKA